MSIRAEFSPPHLQQLVADARNGNTLAFGQLRDLHKDRVYNFVARRLADPVEAEDVAQETFVKAYRALPTFRGACSFYTWLRTIAGNLTIDALRKRQQQRSSYSLDAPVELEDGPISPNVATSSYCQPEAELVTAELQRQVHIAIRELPPKLRTVVVLYELEGLNYAQIAVRLGCPVGTIKSRMFNARNQLKRNLLRSRARQVLAANFMGFENLEAALSQPTQSVAG
ncbi:MAG: sigma-70 family RNA polymerase sigma factor [Armatimonadota bacterium]